MSAVSWLRGATATMRRVVATELNRSPALLALDLTGVNRIDAEGIDAWYRRRRKPANPIFRSALSGCTDTLSGLGSPKPADGTL